MSDQVAPTAILTGVQNVAVPGTQEALAAAAVVRSVLIKAHTANIGEVFIGNTAVSAADGYPLSPGESIGLAIADLNTIWIDAANATDGVTYLGVL